ncbi:hypothetical protein INR49_020306, partial [Caranx melampygus]
MSPWDEQSALRGSPLYMAPEMVCRRQYDSRVDLWSVGVILYETLFGRPPFASRSFAELEEKIRSNHPIELPPGARVSKNCRDLLLRLLERNPDARITFAEFFTHPFVDLEHMPSAESLGKAKELVLQAIQKDQEGERSAALSLYCSALEHFVPAIHYETDRQRKDALRQKVSQYVSRAEELKALVASDNKLSFEAARTSRMSSELSRRAAGESCFTARCRRHRETCLWIENLLQTLSEAPAVCSKLVVDQEKQLGRFTEQQTACQRSAQGGRSTFRTRGKIYAPSWEQHCSSSAIVIIWNAALQKQLARVHEGRIEESRQGKNREQHGPKCWNNRMENHWVLHVWLCMSTLLPGKFGCNFDPDLKDLGALDSSNPCPENREQNRDEEVVEGRMQRGVEG